MKKDKVLPIIWLKCCYIWFWNTSKNLLWNCGIFMDIVGNFWFANNQLVYKKLFYEKTINKNSFINYIVPQIYLIFNTMSLRYVKYVKKCKSNIKATMTSTTAKKKIVFKLLIDLFLYQVSEKILNPLSSNPRALKGLSDT